MLPLVPAGTMAAFAVTVPVTAFNVETVGCDCPAGHAVRKPRMPGGIAVKFREYACAVDGIPQLLERTGTYGQCWLQETARPMVQLHF